jgi:hypothetical protein
MYRERTEPLHFSFLSRAKKEKGFGGRRRRKALTKGLLHAGDVGGKEVREN